MEVWDRRKEGIDMKYMKIEIGDEALEGIVLATNEALQTVVGTLYEDKGETGTVTVKINIEKNTFQDGYKKLRNGLNINYKVDTAVTNKTTYSEEILTRNMMVTESDDGYMLEQAPDPQMSITDYYGEEED